MKALNEAERWIVVSLVKNQSLTHLEAIEAVKRVVHDRDTSDPERVQLVCEEIKRLWTETVQPVLRSVGLID